jgi:hypothetical protein
MTKDPSRHGLEPDSLSERLYTTYQSKDQFGGDWWKLPHVKLRNDWQLDQGKYLEQIEMTLNALKADEQDQPQ